jgi:hypothetical protein
MHRVGEGLLSVGPASGLLDLTLVEQLARYELGGDAEESAKQAADGGQAAGELGVIGVTTPNVANRTPTISESCVLKNLPGSPQSQES